MKVRWYTLQISQVDPRLRGDPQLVCRRTSKCFPGVCPSQFPQKPPRCRATVHSSPSLLPILPPPCRTDNSSQLLSVLFFDASRADSVPSHFADDIYHVQRTVTVEPIPSIRSAPSSFEPEPVQRKRGKFTRSKTGCLTCRTKKVKVRPISRPKYSYLIFFVSLVR